MEPFKRMDSFTSTPKKQPLVLAMAEESCEPQDIPLLMDIGPSEESIPPEDIVGDSEDTEESSTLKAVFPPKEHPTAMDCAADDVADVYVYDPEDKTLVAEDEELAWIFRELGPWYKRPVMRSESTQCLLSESFDQSNDGDVDLDKTQPLMLSDWADENEPCFRAPSRHPVMPPNSPQPGPSGLQKILPPGTDSDSD